jgi:hypothetical protein
MKHRYQNNFTNDFSFFISHFTLISRLSFIKCEKLNEKLMANSKWKMLNEVIEGRV